MRVRILPSRVEANELSPAPHSSRPKRGSRIASKRPLGTRWYDVSRELPGWPPGDRGALEAALGTDAVLCLFRETSGRIEEVRKVRWRPQSSAGKRIWKGIGNSYTQQIRLSGRTNCKDYTASPPPLTRIGSQSDGTSSRCRSSDWPRRTAPSVPKWVSWPGISSRTCCVGERPGPELSGH
jgi:hypothetical protein